MTTPSSRLDNKMMTPCQLFFLLAAIYTCRASVRTSAGDIISIDCGSCGAQATGCAPAAVAATLPSQDQKPLLILLSYHKTGTVWWEQTFLWNQSAHLEVQWILEPFADTYELQSLLDVIAIGNPNMHVVTHITTQLERAGRPWRAVLMTRDPRDSIVSALHYHKWSYESWLQVPNTHWAMWAGLPPGNQLTLQECVRRVNTTTGLLVEMDVFTATLERMCAVLAWQHPSMLVVRYEELWEDPSSHFRTAVDFLYGAPLLPNGTIGTSPHSALADSLYSDAMAYTNHQRARRAARSAARADGATDAAGPLQRHADGRIKADVSRHNRRGKPGEWREAFEDVHKAVFKARFDGLLVGLRYEEQEGAW